MILPIGTIVTLNNQSDLKFMIVGYFPQNESGEQRDYSAIRYPMGVYDNRMYFFSIVQIFVKFFIKVTKMMTLLLCNH